MNAKVAARLGLANGDWVEITSKAGNAHSKLLATELSAPTAFICTPGYGHLSKGLTPLLGSAQAIRRSTKLTRPYQRRPGAHSNLRVGEESIRKQVSLKSNTTLISSTPTRCIDCRLAWWPAASENDIPMNKTRIWVARLGLKGEFPKLERASMVYHCMHCEHPDCMSACPVGAYSKRPDGPVIYNPDVCIAALLYERLRFRRAPLRLR
jgi:ferredoxin